MNQDPTPVEPMSNDEALKLVREWQEELWNVPPNQRKAFIEGKLRSLGTDSQRLARRILMDLLGAPKKAPSGGKTSPKAVNRGP